MIKTKLLNRDWYMSLEQVRNDLQLVFEKVRDGLAPGNKLRTWVDKAEREANVSTHAVFLLRKRCQELMILMTIRSSYFFVGTENTTNPLPHPRRLSFINVLQTGRCAVRYSGL